MRIDSLAVRRSGKMSHTGQYCFDKQCESLQTRTYQAFSIPSFAVPKLIIPPATAQLTTNTPHTTQRYHVYLSAFGEEFDLYLIKNARVAERNDKVKNKLARAVNHP